MKEHFDHPKGFGEILDHTFRLCKSRFPDFFMIALIIIGPIYLLQAIILMLTGTGFIRELGSGDSWFEQIATSLEETSVATSLGVGLGNTLLGLATLVLYPVAQAAVIFAINRMRKNEEFTAGLVIRQGFTKFWPILGSSLLLGVIIFGMVFVPIIIITIFGIISASIEPITGIIVTIVLALGIGLVVSLLITKWSFYLGAVVMEGDAPGLSRSWRLTRKRTWKVFGLLIVFTIIVSIISFAIESIFLALLGNSVLYTIIVSLATLFTSVIFMVGYAVIYFDLTTRHDADDLKGMIEDYNGASK